jgi:hypothetical protein
MIAKPFVLGLLATACVTAAAGGAYVAVRQNPPAEVPTVQPTGPGLAAQAVAETEAVVSPPPAEAAPAASGAAAMRTSPRAERPAGINGPGVRKNSRTPSVPRVEPAVEKPRTTAPAAQPETAAPAAQPPAVAEPAAAPTVSPSSAPPADPVIFETPTVPARPALVEVLVPASSVVGLHVVTSTTSETARVEDRIEARVTRDVLADGRVAIPAGTRVIGDVTLVERGGKMKEKARLGVRFHTLVLANGSQIPFRTDAIFREGASPGAESARKIGGAAVGGAILGAIIGGAKGAAIGGATGAAGGSAVVMAGDRNAATLPAGTIVTVRLSSPVAVDVEREQ